MKKIYLITALMLIAGSLIFSSCSQENAKEISPNTANLKHDDAILKNPPTRDMATVQTRLSNLREQENIPKSQKGVDNVTYPNKYYSIERWDKTASYIEGTTYLSYDGKKLQAMDWVNSESGVVSDETYFTYDDNGRLLYQDMYDIDSDGWRWLGYFYYQYNDDADKTLQYIVYYNTDGSVFRFLYFTYNGNLDKVYQYDYDWDHPAGTYVYKFDNTGRISTVTLDNVSVDTYKYNPTGTIKNISLYNGDRVYDYTYDTPDGYWYSTETDGGAVSNYFVYRIDPSGNANFNLWDPKSALNLNSIDALFF